MARILTSAMLPRRESADDGRRRIDLVTEDLLGVDAFKADRVLYAPGDSAPRHSHPDADQIYFVLVGRAVLEADGEERVLPAGSVAFIPRGETHTLRNDTDAPFEAIEIWVPPPTAPNVWADEGTVCQWRPADGSGGVADGI